MLRVPHGMQPVGLFNRLDLAPKSLANCGEYRIVYVKTTFGRGNLHVSSLIFEAALPNPYNDVVGCQQVAALWSSLKSFSPARAKQTLLKFYYSGGPISSGGLEFGQSLIFKILVCLRDKSDRTGRYTVLPWHLRQWNIKLSPVAPTHSSNRYTQVLEGHGGVAGILFFKGLLAPSIDGTALR